MPRPHPVHPVFVGRDLRPGGFQLVPEAYCSVADGKHRPRLLANPVGKVRGRADERLPNLLRAVIQGGERLRALGVQDREHRVAPFASGRERPQRRDAAQRQVTGLGEPACGRDADPKPGERAGPNAHGNPADAVPSTCFREHSLDRNQQLARVAWPTRRIGILGSLGKHLSPHRDGNAEEGRGSIDSEDSVHGLSVRSAAPIIEVMRLKQAPAVLAACLAFALAGTGLTACGGGEEPDLEPASQEEVQQEVNESLDSTEKGQKARKRAARQADDAEADITNALEEAQEETDDDAENPAY
jgi:hypothetical protein